MEQFLQPRTDAGPSGENLEYDPVFTALMLAAQPGEERQMGDQVIAAEEPDHRDVIQKALAVLERSHDLRAAVVLAQSRMRIDGFEGLAEVTGYIRGLLEDYWDSCHPELDADDDDDPTMRINSVLGLTDANGLVRLVRLGPLSESPAFGRISLRDIAIADGEIEAPEDMTRKPDQAMIAAAFKDTKADVLRARLEAVQAVHDDLKAVDAVFDDRTPGQGPDLSVLLRPLRKALQRMSAALGEDAPVGIAAEEGAAGGAAGGGFAGGMVAQGPVTSPEDVRRVLTQIIRYYEQYEPSSPLPLLIHRAHRLVGADFMTIMRDLSPDAVDDLRKLGGIDGDEDEDDD